jgi:predicted nucleic acid-binding protein
MESVVLDAQALFYLQKIEIPPNLSELREKIIRGNIRVIIPTIVIAELLWKMRHWGRLQEFNSAFITWKETSNIIIDSFDIKILEIMRQNADSKELHDEIIASTCKKYKTDVIYTKDDNFRKNYGLRIMNW